MAVVGWFVNGWLDGWIAGWLDGCVAGWLARVLNVVNAPPVGPIEICPMSIETCPNGWMDGWIAGWLDGCVAGWLARVLSKLRERPRALLKHVQCPLKHVHMA